MATLLVAVALGVIFAVFSTQNTAPISLNFGQYVLPNIPTYLAILIPLLAGLGIALFLHIARDLSQRLTISEQKDAIKNLKKEVAEVTKEAHKFQLESTRLKSENGHTDDEDSI